MILSALVDPSLSSWLFFSPRFSSKCLFLRENCGGETEKQGERVIDKENNCLMKSRNSLQNKRFLVVLSEQAGKRDRSRASCPVNRKRFTCILFTGAFVKDSFTSLPFGG